MSQNSLLEWKNLKGKEKQGDRNQQQVNKSQLWASEGLQG